MSAELTVLLVTAASIGFFHTLFGPDHYLPFIVMSKARKWSLGRTTVITVLCGVGHVLSSIVIGFIGIAAGIAVTSLEGIEGTRGGLAAWAFIAFGVVYFIWGVRKAIRNRPHEHLHLHADTDHCHDGEHDHEHRHDGEHVHPHEEKRKSMTPWVLFTIFVLGPCEPLIPILMYPAAKGSAMGIVAVTATFAAVTIATMTGMVLFLSKGISLVPLGRLERYGHALAGATICLSGAAIQFLGL